MKPFLILSLLIFICSVGCDDEDRNELQGTKWQSLDDSDLMEFTSDKINSYSFDYSGGCYVHWTSCYSVSGNTLRVDLLCWGDEIKKAVFRISNDTLYTTAISDDPYPETYSYVAFAFDESELNLCPHTSLLNENSESNVR